MKLPRYPKYKDSGVKWLGQVPEHWDTRRIRFLFQIKKRIAGADGYDVLSITQQGIKVKDIESNGGQLAMDYSKYQLVEIGDFAMNHMDLLTGYVDISGSLGVTSPDYRVFSLKNQNACYDRYFLYLFQNAYRRKIFFPFGQGASQLGRWRLPTEQFQDFVLPVPPRQEQTAIAALLDHRIDKTDALIEEQRRLIELLKEKRQATISHTVTKGLNPDAPMKESGIRGMDAVPKHWDVTVIKRFSTLQRGHDLTDTERTEGPYPVVTSGGISGTHGAFKAYGPGVVTGRYGSTGRLFFIDENFWPHNTSLYVSDFHGNHVRFVWYALQTVDFAAHSAKSAVPGIDRNDIHVLPVVVPPHEEQLAISHFLDGETARVDSLIAEATHAIDLLQERRSAFISAAITGQIDVRNYRSQEAPAVCQ
jgi:type I restriction enzyme S subunit